MNPIHNILSQVAGLPVKEAQPAKVVQIANVVRAESVSAIPVAPHIDPEPAKAEQPTAISLEIVEYSEKSYALKGNTKELKDKIKELGAVYVPNSKIGKVWCFSKKKLPEFTTFVNQFKTN